MCNLRHVYAGCQNEAVNVKNVQNNLFKTFYENNEQEKAIAKRSRVSCARNRSTAFKPIVTSWPWNRVIGITEGNWKQHHSIDHIQLTISWVLLDIEYYGDLEMWVTQGHWFRGSAVP